jgi:hypothetical protein
MRPIWLRLGLGLLAVFNLFTGIWAIYDPEGWWESFPGFGHEWVSAYGAYNEHLVRDVGGFFLGFGVLFLLAAIFVEKRFAIGSVIAWLCFATPHLIFHMGDRGTLSDSDNLLSLEALAFEVALPILLLVAISRTDFRTREQRETQAWDDETMTTLKEDWVPPPGEPSDVNVADDERADRAERDGAPDSEKND